VGYASIYAEMGAVYEANSETEDTGLGGYAEARFCKQAVISPPLGPRKYLDVGHVARLVRAMREHARIHYRHA
jgi:hypothetical protein